MSVSRRILISSPSTLISVPEYLPKRTSSPSTTPIGDAFAGVEHLAGADREDLAALGLLLGRVRQDDPAGRLLLGLDLLDHDAVFERANLGHRAVFLCLMPESPGRSPREGPAKIRDWVGLGSRRRRGSSAIVVETIGWVGTFDRPSTITSSPCRPCRPCHPFRPCHPSHRRGRRDGRDRPPAAFFSFFSTMIASVVSRRPATDAAFWSAERVTLAGSTMPAASMSPHVPVVGVVAEVGVGRLHGSC